MKCEGCGIEFTPNTPKQRFHNRTCANRNNTRCPPKKESHSALEIAFREVMGDFPRNQGEIDQFKLWQARVSDGRGTSTAAREYKPY
jgi:hypothetical protein